MDSTVSKYYYYYYYYYYHFSHSQSCSPPPQVCSRTEHFGISRMGWHFYRPNVFPAIQPVLTELRDSALSNSNIKSNPNPTVPNGNLKCNVINSFKSIPARESNLGVKLWHLYHLANQPFGKFFYNSLRYCSVILLPELRIKLSYISSETTVSIL